MGPRKIFGTFTRSHSIIGRAPGAIPSTPTPGLPHGASPLPGPIKCSLMFPSFKSKTLMNSMKLRTNPAAGLIRDELEARNIPAARAARDMAIPRSRLSDIFAGRKTVSADTALRFERYLGISAGLLIRLQAESDLSKAVADKGLQIRKEILPATQGAVA